MHHVKKNSRLFEALEHRAMLTSNVIVAVDGGGNLTVTGDSAADNVFMAETVSGGWRIQGVKTKINGQKQMVTAPVTGNINIDLGSGKDVLELHDGIIPAALSITMGAGKNTAALWNLRIATSLNFQGNGIHDNLWIDHVEGSTANFATTIDMQGGKDTLTINHFSGDAMSVSLGAGKDKVSLKNSQFLGGSAQQLTIDAGDDKDVVSISQVQTSALEIDMGGGEKDTLALSKVMADTADFLDTGGIKGTISGNGDDITTQTIDPNFIHRGGDLKHNI